jgi:type II secretory pathway component PulF
MVLVHLAVWLAFFSLILMVPPRYEQRFRDFNMRLPAATEVVIAIAHWTANYWYVLLVWSPFLLAADSAILHVLRSRRQTGLAWSWFLVGVAAPLLLGLAMGGSLYLADAKLREAQSR